MEESETRAAPQEVRSEEMLASLALLKILALGSRQVEEGRLRGAEEVISELRRTRA